MTKITSEQLTRPGTSIMIDCVTILIVTRVFFIFVQGGIWLRRHGAGNTWVIIPQKKRRGKKYDTEIPRSERPCPRLQDQGQHMAVGYTRSGWMIARYLNIHGVERTQYTSMERNAGTGQLVNATSIRKEKKRRRSYGHKPLRRCASQTLPNGLEKVRLTGLFK